jgi:hypothetical protein
MANAFIKVMEPGKAVLEYLAPSPYSSTYHEAEPHHGGAGATVVQTNF